MEEITRKAGQLAGIIRKGKSKPWVRQLAASIIYGEFNGFVQAKNYHGEIKNIFEYVRDHIHYVRDPYKMDLFSPLGWTNGVGIGDCDDYATLLGALLASVGNKVYLKVTDYGDGRGYSHVYILVGEEKTPLDPTLDHAQVGQEVKYAQARVFEV